MKKFGLLATLGCLVTVGGVYAQWVYGQASAGSMSESIIPQMAGVGESSKKGTISLVTSGLHIVIDDTNGDYKPELRIEGKVVVTFTASPGADDTVKTSGIKMKYSLSMTENWQYDSDWTEGVDKNIFALQGAYTDVLVGGGNPVPSFEIGASWFQDVITLNMDPDFKIDTKEKFDTFKSYLNKESSLFTVTVSEVA